MKNHTTFDKMAPDMFKKNNSTCTECGNTVLKVTALSKGRFVYECTKCGYNSLTEAQKEGGEE